MLTRLTTLARRYWPATLLVSVGAIWALYQMASGWHRRHLAEMEVARLRSLGIPTNANELTLFVARPTGFPDATSVWKIPLDAIESGSIGRPPYGLKVLDERDHQPSLPGENWDQLEQAEKYLARYATLYRQIDDATAAPGECTLLVDFSEGAMMTLPHVDGSYRIMNLLRLRAYVHLHHGDNTAAARDVESMLRVATIHRFEPVSVSQHIYSRHVELGLRTLERLLPYMAGEEETLARMQAHLETIDMRASLRLVAMGDRVLGITTLDDPSTAGVGPVPPSLYGVWVGDDKHKLLETLKDLDHRFSGPWPAPLQAISEYDIPADREEDVISPWGGEEWFTPSGFARQRVKLVEVFARTQARANSAATALAMVRFQRKYGDWPPSLDDLVPEYLSAIPIDPFTGGPIVMSRDNESFRLYSVGPNLQDDGGVETEDLDKPDTPSGRPDVLFRLRLPLESSE